MSRTAQFVGRQANQFRPCAFCCCAVAIWLRPTVGQARTPMLDERQTLRILGWMLGTICLSTFVLSALALR